MMRLDAAIVPPHAHPRQPCTQPTTPCPLTPQVAMTERFAQLWGDKGVGVYSMHPGWAETDGVRNAMPGFFNTFKNKFRDTYMGVDTVVWLALQVGGGAGGIVGMAGGSVALH
jgi:hypothetical protein